MEFAAGAFSAIAILQEEFYHPVIIELLKIAGSSYLEGLNVIENLGDFLSVEMFVHYFSRGVR
jgi:hypothetical protein